MDYSTVTSDGFEISSTESLEDMEAAIAKPPSDEAAETGDAMRQSAGDGEGGAEDATGASSSAATVTEKPKADKRTREGKKQSIQAEIDELTAKREAARKEVEAEEARLAQALSAAAAMGRQQSVDQAPSRSAISASSDAGDGATQDDPEPKFDQFLNEPDAATAYWSAKASWEARRETRKALDAFRAQQQQSAASQSRLSQMQASQARTLETIRKNLNGQSETDFFAKVNPDVLNLKPIAQVAYLGEQPTGGTAIADSILESSHPDKLLVYFTEQPAELRRISQLPPHLALREMGILEGQFRTAAASHGPAPTRQFSTAPPPTKPLGGPPSVSDKDDDVDDMSPEAVDRYITKSQTARRQSRR